MKPQENGLRLPPHSIEAEEGTLGAILLDGAIAGEIRMILKPEDFYRADHVAIFRSMTRLADEGVPVDYISVSDELMRLGDLTGGALVNRLAALIDAVPHAANAVYHARIVSEKSRLRALADAATQTLRDCYSNRLLASECIERSEQRFFAIGEHEATRDTVPIAHLAGLALDRISGRKEGLCYGVATGIPDFDELTDGLANGSLVILAARPSMGKTALALQIAEHASIDEGIPTLFISLEMSGMELGERVLVGRAGVDGHRVRTGASLQDDEVSALGCALGDLRARDILRVDESALRTVGQIAANARRHKARNHIGLLVIDYLTLIEVERDMVRQSSRQEQVAMLSRRLKALAKELNIPILCLSQLNRQSESRDDRRPRLSDLRESGAVEQDADMVLLLHRPEYYRPDDQPGVAELIVAKNRNGSVGTIRLSFRKQSMRFGLLAEGF